MARQAYTAFADKRIKSPSETPRTKKQIPRIKRNNMQTRTSRFVLRWNLVLGSWNLRSSDSTAAFLLHHMQPAFFFDGACPTPRPFILAISHRATAGPATDARIAPIVKGIVRNIMLHNE